MACCADLPYATHENNRKRSQDQANLTQIIHQWQFAEISLPPSRSKLHSIAGSIPARGKIAKGALYVRFD
jgi:hypothetical protein